MSSHSLPAAASRCPVVNGTAFGPLGAAECRDPMPWLRAAQHSAPVFFMPRYDMWCVIRYEDVIEVLRDPVTYSSRKTINLDKLPPDLLSAFPDGPPDRVLVSLDPPGHTRLRGLAQKAFTPKPDWLGFGGTDKLRDFVSGSDRMIRHMSAFLQAMAIEQAGFADASMGATMLLREAARPGCRFPIRRLVVASGGGFVPDNEERRRLLSYDGTPEAMRAILRANFHDPAWAQDDAYVKRRVEASLAPGAREAIAAARLKPPTVPPRADSLPHARHGRCRGQTPPPRLPRGAGPHPRCQDRGPGWRGPPAQHREGRRV